MAVNVFSELASVLVKHNHLNLISSLEGTDFFYLYHAVVILKKQKNYYIEYSIKIISMLKFFVQQVHYTKQIISLSEPLSVG